MAKRKKRSTPTRRRSRGRINGAGAYKDEVMMAAGAIAGGVVARMVGNTFLKGKDPKLISIVNVAGGAFIANKARDPLFKGLGIGIMTEGGITLLQRTGLIGAAGEGETYYLSGDDDSMDGFVEDDINGLYPASYSGGFVESAVSGDYDSAYVLGQ